MPPPYAAFPGTLPIEGAGPVLVAEPGRPPRRRPAAAGRRGGDRAGRPRRPAQPGPVGRARAGHRRGRSRRCRGGGPASPVRAGRRRARRRPGPDALARRVTPRPRSGGTRWTSAPSGWPSCRPARTWWSTLSPSPSTVRIERRSSRSRAAAEAPALRSSPRRSRSSAARRGAGRSWPTWIRLSGGADLLLGAETVPGLRWPQLARARGRLGGGMLREALPRLDGLSVLSWDRTDRRPDRPTGRRPTRDGPGGRFVRRGGRRAPRFRPAGPRPASDGRGRAARPGCGSSTSVSSSWRRPCGRARRRLRVVTRLERVVGDLRAVVGRLRRSRAPGRDGRRLPRPALAGRAAGRARARGGAGARGAAGTAAPLATRPVRGPPAVRPSRPRGRPRERGRRRAAWTGSARRSPMTAGSRLPAGWRPPSGRPGSCSGATVCSTWSTPSTPSCPAPARSRGCWPTRT